MATGRPSSTRACSSGKFDLKFTNDGDDCNRTADAPDASHRVGVCPARDLLSSFISNARVPFPTTPYADCDCVFARDARDVSATAPNADDASSSSRNAACSSPSAHHHPDALKCAHATSPSAGVASSTPSDTTRVLCVSDASEALSKRPVDVSAQPTDHRPHRGG